MRNGIVATAVIGLLGIGILISGCKKESTLGIDNDQVVEIPYSLYMADDEGGVATTTDGLQYGEMFPPDGFNGTILTMSGENLLMLKDNLHMSSNGSSNFNPVYLHVNHFPWQSSIYNYPAQNRVYIASKEGKGVSYSEDNGATWEIDENWVADPQLPPVFEISSFAGLASGKLFGFSNLGNVLLEKDGADGNWKVTPISGSFHVQPSEYFLVSNDNTLFLVDYLGTGGVWYSTDEGHSWTRYTASTSDKKYLAAISPVASGTALVVGSEGNGVFRGTAETGFEHKSGGLETDAVANAFVNKHNTFKNGDRKDYVYLGTDRGLYRSEDAGRTWYLVTTGTWRRNYISLN